MEPCINHSGLEATLKYQGEKVNECADGLRRVHQRIDEVHDAMQEMKDELSGKLTQYAEQMTAQYQETIKAFQCEGGIFDEVKDLKRNQTLVFKIGAWVGSLAGALILFFREQIGKFAKWFFFGS